MAGRIRSIRLHPETDDALTAFAKHHKMTVSEALRRLVERGLEIPITPYEAGYREGKMAAVRDFRRRAAAVFREDAR
jgi:hypothetical protein